MTASTTLLAQIVEDLATVIDQNPEISSKILLLRPGEMRDRSHGEVVTGHVFELLMDQVRSKWGAWAESFHVALENPRETKPLLVTPLKTTCNKHSLLGKCSLS